jgi:hypothetical protein
MPPKRRPRTVSISARKPKRPRNGSSETQSTENTKHDLVPARPPLLAPPRELRDQIYHEVWKEKPPFEVVLPDKTTQRLTEGSVVHFDRKCHVFKISSGDCEEPSEAASSPRTKTSKGTTPPWIFANRQILEEAMEQFNRQTSWNYVEKRNREQTKDRTVIPSRISVSRSQSRRRQIQHLLALQNACAIKLSQAVKTSIFGKMDDKERPIHTMDCNAVSTELLQMIGSGIGGTTNLKRLHILLPHRNSSIRTFETSYRYEYTGIGNTGHAEPSDFCAHGGIQRQFANRRTVCKPTHSIWRR